MHCLLVQHVIYLDLLNNDYVRCVCFGANVLDLYTWLYIYDIYIYIYSLINVGMPTKIFRIIFYFS